MRSYDRPLDLASVKMWTAGLVAGVLSAKAYPSLRYFSSAMQADGCLQTMGLGVCGGIPLALQDFFKSTVGLLFSFLLGYTFYILIARQQVLTNVLFEETSVLSQIIEEAPLYLPPQDVRKIVALLRQYVANLRLTLDGRLDPVELSARNVLCSRDPVEEISRILIEGANSGDAAYDQVLAILRSLRVARSRRLAALQSPVPEEQIQILTFLAVLAALPPFLEPSGMSNGPSQVLYGLLVSVLVVVLVQVRDVAEPGGIYGVARERAILLDALDETLINIEAECAAEA